MSDVSKDIEESKQTSDKSCSKEDEEEMNRWRKRKSHQDFKDLRDFHMSRPVFGIEVDDLKDSGLY